MARLPRLRVPPAVRPYEANHGAYNTACDFVPPYLD